MDDTSPDPPASEENSSPKPTTKAAVKAWLPVGLGLLVFLVLPVLLILLKVTAPESPPAPPPKVSAPFKVIGYLPDYRIGRLKDGPWKEYLTDVIYFSIEPRENGDLDLTRFRSRDWQRIGEVARSRKMETWICVGGWGRGDGFSAMATNAATRAQFIRNLVGFCREHAFGGVDYDWEFPRGIPERAAYNDLIIETARAFEPHGMKVSVAAGIPMSFRPSTYEALDYVNLMSYNHDGRHATFENSAQDIRNHLRYGVPPQKLILGLPFYGRHVEARHKTLGYAQLLQSYPTNWTEMTDELDGYYFNGVSTIRRKTQHALDMGLGGVMVWEIGLDREDDLSLLKAIHATIVKNSFVQNRP